MRSFSKAKKALEEKASGFSASSPFGKSSSQSSEPPAGQPIVQGAGQGNTPAVATSTSPSAPVIQHGHGAPEQNAQATYTETAHAPPVSSYSSSSDPSQPVAGDNSVEHEVYSESPVTTPLETPQEAQPSRPKTESKKSSMSLPSWGRSSSKQSLPKEATEQSSPSRSESKFKLKVPKPLRGLANLSEVDIDFAGGDVSIVSDSKKKERKEGLCTACSKIDFEQFETGISSSDEKFTRKLIFLDRILRKKRNNSCKFCSLIFDAMAENDPFQHPAVKDYLPPDLGTTNFKQWAESLSFSQHIPLYKSAYPFGRSRDSIKLQQDAQGEEIVVEGKGNSGDISSEDAAKGLNVVAAGAVTTGIWTDTDKERIQIMGTVGTLLPTVTMMMSDHDKKLPVAISIIIHNVNDVDAGVLNIDVWGYGNGPRAPLSRLSTFNLRVAADYHLDTSGNLTYGNILQAQIDVEGDCKVWLENCSEQHGRDCEEPTWWHELPHPSGPHFRLIDVVGMRVVQADSISPTTTGKPRYAALSYVWGAVGKHRLNLYVKNLEALSLHLGNQTPPVAKTISDAIEVTRRMGLQYLWVDSLCIIQYDENGEDHPEARRSQIEQMDSIFGHAAVTLVAADGLDAEAGLSGVTTGPTRCQIATRILNVNVLLAVQYDNSYGKWDTRAWTLQEKLLSKRLLIFNKGYVSFHCRHGILREDMPAGHSGNGPAEIPWLSLSDSNKTSLIKRAWDGTPALLRSAFFSEYAKLLNQYTSRDMTDSNDALNAVLGLLKVLERMTKAGGTSALSGHSESEKDTLVGYTLHGLPEEFLDLALLWQPPAVKGVYLTKRPQDDLPSWSWTGWEVSKDPDAYLETAKVYQAKPGVRFEEPFWVATNDDLSLKKVLARGKAGGEPEERLKPLVMWYKCLTPPATQGAQRAPTSATTTLMPVNGDGLGLASGPADTAELHKFREAAIKLRTNVDSPTDPGAPVIKTDAPIDNRHLVCETQVAGFRLRPIEKPRQEVLWKKTDKGLDIDTELIIHELEILDASDKVVGRVIPTDPRKNFSRAPYSFILLSESQYWGNETRVDIIGLPLFNVMLVEWDTRGEFATRVGLGKIEKCAWWAADPKLKVVILK